jgi:hypothetical protein
MAMHDDDLGEVLEAVAARADCRVLPPDTWALPVGLTVPADLGEFSRRCGGLVLFENADFPWWVWPVGHLVPAGPRLLGAETARQVAADDPEELTNGCFVVADDGTGASTAPHVVIDLNTERAGRCYVTGWDTFGLVGDMPIIAVDMAGLIRWLLEAGGTSPYGLERKLGDAYQPML